MKSSKVKPKIETKRNVKSKSRFVSIEEPNAKFKNEVFQKLWERNNASKEKLNTIEYNDNNLSKKYHYSPRSNSNYNNHTTKNSKRKNLKKMYQELSKSKKNIQIINNDKNDSSNAIKSKVMRVPYNLRKYKDYPNLIGGVLHQVNYYNINNNNNYNDYIRYKPIDDIFNEQSSILSTKKVVENNNNSPNMSFNSDLKQDLKSDHHILNQNMPKNNSNNENINNIKKIKVEEENDNDNNNDNIYNNYNVESEMRVNPDSIKTRKSGTLEKNGKLISPIISAVGSNEIKIKKDNHDKNNYIQDIIGGINGNKLDNINEDDNDNNKVNKDKDKSNNSIVKKKKRSKNLTPKHFNVVEKDEKKLKERLSIVNNNNFTIYNNNRSNNNNKSNYKKLKKTPINTFSIHNYKDKNKDEEIKKNNFDNLELIRCNTIKYINNKINKKKDNKRDEIDDGKLKLKFKDEDEVLDYIKKKLNEEKELEYNKNRIKYNYFILMKKFHGKILYEIGLENNIESINNILHNENVEIEHEPVVFIKRKELEQLKNNPSFNNNKIINNDENKQLKKEIEKINKENEKMNKEYDKLSKENEKLKKKMDLINKNLEEKNSNLINEYNKLIDEIEKLKEYNKEIEDELKNKKNIIDEYEDKIKEYENKLKEDNNKLKDKSDKPKDYDKLVEDNNRLLMEREKFTKYIYELQEYDEKVINEYHKVKNELENEKKKNMNNNNNNNDKKNNNNKYEIDYLSEEFIIEKKNGIDEEIQTEEIKDEPYKNNNIKKYTLNPKNKNSGTIYKHTKVEDSKPTYYTKNDEDKKKNERIYDKYNEVEVNRNNEKDNIIDDNETIEDNNNKKKNKVSFGVKNDSNDIDEQYKREESMSRAMRRINNRRKLDKMNEDKNKFRKSKKITGMAEKLQDKLKNDDRKLFVDLEYEKNRAEEEEEEEEEYYDN